MMQKQTLVDFFSEDSVSSNVAYKNRSLKKSILKHLDVVGDLTIPELTKELNITLVPFAPLSRGLMSNSLEIDKLVDKFGKKKVMQSALLCLIISFSFTATIGLYKLPTLFFIVVYVLLKIVLKLN